MAAATRAGCGVRAFSFRRRYLHSPVQRLQVPLASPSASRVRGNPLWKWNTLASSAGQPLGIQGSRGFTLEIGHAVQPRWQVPLTNSAGQFRYSPGQPLGIRGSRGSTLEKDRTRCPIPLANSDGRFRWQTPLTSSAVPLADPSASGVRGDPPRKKIGHADQFHNPYFTDACVSRGACRRPPF